MKIIKRLINDYREANANGDVDLIFSPYYHPILPLIYDTRSARRAREDVLLPHLILNVPQDVECSFEKGGINTRSFSGEHPEVFGLRNSRFRLMEHANRLRKHVEEDNNGL